MALDERLKGGRSPPAARVIKSESAIQGLPCDHSHRARSPAQPCHGYDAAGRVG